MCRYDTYVQRLFTVYIRSCVRAPKPDYCCRWHALHEKPRIDSCSRGEGANKPRNLTCHVQARGRRRGRGCRDPAAKADERLQARGAPAAETVLRGLVLLGGVRPPALGIAASGGRRGRREGTAAPDAAAAAAAASRADGAPGARGEAGAEAHAALGEGGGGVAGGGAGRGEGACGEVQLEQGRVLTLGRFQVRQHRHERVPHVVHGPETVVRETHSDRQAGGQRRGRNAGGRNAGGCVRENKHCLVDFWEQEEVCVSLAQPGRARGLAEITKLAPEIPACCCARFQKTGAPEMALWGWLKSRSSRPKFRVVCARYQKTGATALKTCALACMYFMKEE